MLGVPEEVRTPAFQLKTARRQLRAIKINIITIEITKAELEFRLQIVLSLV
jgi:hypothetical protein